MSYSPLPAPAGATPAKPISSWLAPAILVTLFCCPPFGIPAIVFASRVPSLLAVGDLAGAQQASRRAKMWTLIAAVSAVVWIVLCGVLMFAGLWSAGQAFDEMTVDMQNGMVPEPSPLNSYGFDRLP